MGIGITGAWAIRTGSNGEPQPAEAVAWQIKAWDGLICTGDFAQEQTFFTAMCLDTSQSTIAAPPTTKIVFMRISPYFVFRPSEIGLPSPAS
jgi:hypothetical protein